MFLAFEQAIFLVADHPEEYHEVVIDRQCRNSELGM